MAAGFRSRLVALTFVVGIPAVGAILLVAAMLKLHAMILHGVGLTNGAATTALVAAEMALGGLLLFAPPSRPIVTATALVFTFFAGYSVYLLTTGKPNCNCFGVLSTRIWHTLGIDLLCVALLASALVFGQFQVWNKEACRLAAWFAATSVMCAASLGLVLMIADNVPMVAWIRGEAVRLHRRTSDPVTAAIGQERSVNIKVTNRWREPVTLVGGSFGCACNVTEDLPVTLRAGESRDLRLTISAFRNPGRFRVPMHFFTDIPWQPEVHGVLTLVVSGQPRQTTDSALSWEHLQGQRQLTLCPSKDFQ